MKLINQVYPGLVEVYWHHQGERESILAKMQGAETPDIDEQNQVDFAIFLFFGEIFLDLLIALMTIFSCAGSNDASQSVL